MDAFRWSPRAFMAHRDWLTTMGEDFTHRAYRALSGTNMEAHSLNARFRTTGHILLSVLRESAFCQQNPIGADKIVHSAYYDKVRALLQRYGHTEHEMVLENILPFTPRAKKSVYQSRVLVRSFGHSSVSTVHLLLALLFDERTEATMILHDLDVEIPVLRKRLLTEVIRNSFVED